MSDLYKINEKINEAKYEIKAEISDVKHDLQNRLRRIETDRDTNNMLLKFGLMIIIYMLVLSLISKKHNNQKKAEKESHSAFVFSSK